MKLNRLDELEMLNYIELYPGKLKKGYMNEESIYISDDNFSLIVSAVKRGFEQYEPFNSFEIAKSQWVSILNEIEKLCEMLNEFHDDSKLNNFISIFFKETNLKKTKIEEMLKKREMLISLLEDLAEWINAQLELNDYITLIGI